MYVCIYVCMYVSMYVCMYICISHVYVWSYYCIYSHFLMLSVFSVFPRYCILVEVVGIHVL